jgi:predicted nuclease of predicted toxin-antitoxin system
LKILANENVAAALVRALAEAGHDVAWIAKDAPGAADVDVIDRTISDGRVLLTFDKDFGELAFKHGLPISTGVILVRVQVPDAEALANTVLAALSSRDDWTGHFSVIESGRIRMTPLPASAD